MAAVAFPSGKARRLSSSLIIVATQIRSRGTCGDGDGGGDGEGQGHKVRARNGAACGAGGAHFGAACDPLELADQERRKARVVGRELSEGGLALARDGTREVSTLCWAFGRLRLPAPDLLDTLCARALPRLCQFTPQGLANTAWGLARAAHAAPEAFDAIAEEVRHSSSSYPYP